jgi:ribosomal protein L25 (general stress protein Ctc)
VVFDDEKANKIKTIQTTKELKTIIMKDISKHIIRKAIWKNDFYKFDNLTKYL